MCGTPRVIRAIAATVKARLPECGGESYSRYVLSDVGLKCTRRTGPRDISRVSREKRDEITEQFIIVQDTIIRKTGVTFTTPE